MDLLELLIVDLLSEKRIPIAGRTRSKVVNGAPTINALLVV